MIRLGLIGCGSWGWRYIPTALEAGNAKVTHVYRVSKNTLSNEKAAPHVSDLTVIGDWKMMVDCPVDAIVVATPPDTHEEICEYFLSRGRPVMVEKPMALSVGAALAIKAAAKDTPFLVNHLHLFSSAYEKLREIVVAAKPTRCRVYSRAGNAGPYRTYSALWDYGPHDVAMCLGLGFGHPTGVFCLRMPDEFGCVQLGCQRFDVNVCFGPHEANIQVWNGALPKERHFEVLWQGTRLVYDELEPNGILLRCNNNPVEISPEKPLTRSLRAFAEAVATGQTDWRFGADIATVSTRILHTADTGTVHA